MFAVQVVLFLGNTYSIGRVDGGFRKSIASATDSLGKPSQVTTGSLSSTRSGGCAKEGRIEADYREEEKRRLGRQEAKGQVYAMDEGRGVIPLRGGGSDRAPALPHSTAMYAIAARCVEALEVHRARWGDSGVGGCTLEDCYGACLSIRCRSWWMDE